MDLKTFEIDIIITKCTILQNKTSPQIFRTIQIVILTVVLLLLLLVVVLFKIVQVEGNSMYPTIKSGTILLVQRHNIFTKELQKNDIIVFNHNGTQYIKRIVAVSGDKISSENAFLKIGDMVYEKYPYTGDMYKLDKNEVFVVGDNAEKSMDSCHFGVINKDEIIGKCIISEEKRE